MICSKIQQQYYREYYTEIKRKLLELVLKSTAVETASIHPKSMSNVCQNKCNEAKTRDNVKIKQRFYFDI